MAAPTTTETSGKVVIRNVGLMLSGDIDRPILDADTVVVENIDEVRHTTSRSTC